MGQQQLLLIVLGAIIVGIAIVAGLQIFQASRIDTNRDAITADLTYLASKAIQHLKKPAILGGGEQYFDGFVLTPIDRSNSDGEFRITSLTEVTQLVTTAPSANTDNTAVAQGANISLIYFTGYGKERGRDGQNLVQVYAEVTENGFNITIVN
jgi:hypothetical protein